MGKTFTEIFVEQIKEKINEESDELKKNDPLNLYNLIEVINKLRSGRSLWEEDNIKKIDKIFQGLTQSEQKIVYEFLKDIAGISIEDLGYEL
jgi:hypothetical protein